MTRFRFEKQFPHYIYDLQGQEKLGASLGKNLNDCEEIRNETYVYEQKHVKIDDFNETEEKQVKKQVEKRKQKRREMTENNELLKKEEKTRA